MTGLNAKAERVLAGTMTERLAGTKGDWTDVTEANVYTIHDIYPLLASTILPALHAASLYGIRWHFTRPPVLEIEFEMDMLGVRREIMLGKLKKHVGRRNFVGPALAGAALGSAPSDGRLPRSVPNRVATGRPIGRSMRTPRCVPSGRRNDGYDCVAASGDTLSCVSGSASFALKSAPCFRRTETGTSPLEFKENA